MEQEQWVVEAWEGVGGGVFDGQGSGFHTLRVNRVWRKENSILMFIWVD